MSTEAAPAGLRFRQLAPDDVTEIARWRYEEPYALYDVRPEDAQRMLEPAYEYYAAVGVEGELIGFCCFGEDARVPGLEEAEGVLDVGGGLRPDLTGIGLGAGFLRAVCELGRELHSPDGLRLAVAAFNVRAQRVAFALGFERVGVHATAEREFALMQRPA